jgi:hypothetical protein
MLWDVLETSFEGTPARWRRERVLGICTVDTLNMSLAVTR